MRQVTISKALNGLLVYVGRQTLVFNSTEEFITELRRYLADPAGTEKEFLSRYGKANDYTLQGIGMSQAVPVADARYGTVPAGHLETPLVYTDGAMGFTTR